LPTAETRLTKGQKDCLRLVATGISSKEIAIRLKLSPKTVDTYVKQACDRLGTMNRRDAARQFLAEELSEKSRSEPPALVLFEPIEPEPAHTGENGQPTKRGIPPVGGSPNDLDWLGKTGMALRISLVGVAIILAILLVFVGLLQLFH
jgi:DNA-binding CsgD family transcriptional regulator